MGAPHECWTWKVVPWPKAKNVGGYKWDYKIKHKPHGSIDTYKVQLMEQGFTQHEEDCDETFSPIIKMSIIRIIVSLAMDHGLKLNQMDVKNIFCTVIWNGKCIQKNPRICREGFLYIGMYAQKISI